LSCWLRANALLLPLFLSALAVLIVPTGRRLSAALTIVASAVLVIAPVTIKNAVVFHRFIPLSLGTGQTLLEGIADYDEQIASVFLKRISVFNDRKPTCLENRRTLTGCSMKMGLNEIECASLEAFKLLDRIHSGS